MVPDGQLDTTHNHCSRAGHKHCTQQTVGISRYHPDHSVFGILTCSLGKKFADGIEQIESTCMVKAPMELLLLKMLGIDMYS